MAFLLLLAWWDRGFAIVLGRPLLSVASFGGLVDTGTILLLPKFTSIVTVSVNILLYPGKCLLLGDPLISVAVVVNDPCIPLWLERIELLPNLSACFRRPHFVTSTDSSIAFLVHDGFICLICTCQEDIIIRGTIMGWILALGGGTIIDVLLSDATLCMAIPPDDVISPRCRTRAVGGGDALLVAKSHVISGVIWAIVGLAGGEHFFVLSALSTMVGTALLEAFTSPCSKNISLGTAAEIAPPIVRAGSSSDIATAGQ